jgi:hypothetical protein
VQRYANCQQQGGNAATVRAVKFLRRFNFLFTVFHSIINIIIDYYFRFLLIAHVCYMKEQTYKHGLKNLTAKAATALLRYTTDIPVDKYFYDAGSILLIFDLRILASLRTIINYLILYRREVPRSQHGRIRLRVFEPLRGLDRSH